ncbi:Nn.00g113660.m01.CDS01 [Neocucurbitaria sp. VM-36]
MLATRSLRSISLNLSRAQPATQTSTRRTWQDQQHAFRLIRYSSSSAPSRFKPVGNTVDLPSGRTLGYHTSGDPNGIPVIYIHGNPDSGIQITGELEKKVAKKLGVQWIGPDRPAVGLSTMCETQQVVDYSHDVQCLVKHLSLKEYYILGTSGGTGFALTCAKDLKPSQLRGVGICAGVGPVECGFDSMGETFKKAWDMWRDYPTEMEAYIEAEYAHLAQASDSSALRARIVTDLKSCLTGDDLNHVLQEDILVSAVQGYRQIYAQGAAAHAKGIKLNLRPWGFKMEDIKLPSIKFWYGSDDVNTTPTMGKYMADRLPDAVYKEYPGKSHFTIWNEEILEEMLRDLINVKDQE